MVALGIAVLVASLLGSLHCVGMCGPLALWATGGGQHRGTIAAYHLGRLSTYLIAGFFAGLLGSAVNISGDTAGYQMLAAKIAGMLLVIAGMHRLLSLHPRFRFAISGENPSRVAALLQKAKPLLSGRGPRGRAYLGGLMTTWLPCGWLYLFVLLAAGTGGLLSALTVMSAFWFGTLPALTAVWFGAKRVVPRIGAALPVVAGVLLIVTGLYTATGRAAADLSNMTAPQIVEGQVANGQVANRQLANGQSRQSDVTLGATSLTGLAQQPLPCCSPEATETPLADSQSSENP